RFEIRIKSFANSVRSQDVQDLASLIPEETESDLAAAIADGTQPMGTSGQAVLLLSDGIQNSAGGGPQTVLSAARNARGAGVPVYTQVFGKNSDVTDLAIRLPMTQQVAFAGQRVPVVAFVKRRGHVSPEARISLWQDGQLKEEKEITLEKTQESEAAFSV